MKFKTTDYQVKNKWFYAVPSIFPLWSPLYPSRLAIGMSLNDSTFKDKPVYRFRVKNTMYEITKEKAEEIVIENKVGFGALPHLIPKEALKIVADDLPEVPVYEFDEVTKTARIRLPSMSGDMVKNAKVMQISFEL